MLFNADEHFIGIIGCILLFNSYYWVQNAFCIRYLLNAGTYKVTVDHTTKQNSLCLRR